MNIPKNKPLGRKIVVVGVSASGKSTFSRKLSIKTNLPLVLMDSIMWTPGWNYIGDAETVKKLEDISAEEEWIIEGYIPKDARTRIFERADTIIHLDYRPLVSVIRYVKRWLRHRKDPRPELEGSPEKFSFKFLKLVWTKGEDISLNKFLARVTPQDKIIRFNSPRETKIFLNNI